MIFCVVLLLIYFFSFFFSFSYYDDGKPEGMDEAS